MNKTFTVYGKYGYVYGGYGYVSETVLFTSTSEREAIEWAKDYVQDGDTGAYDVIEVAYHADDGEYYTVYTYRRPDFEDNEDLDDEW